MTWKASDVVRTFAPIFVHFKCFGAIRMNISAGKIVHTVEPISEPVRPSTNSTESHHITINLTSHITLTKPHLYFKITCII